mmetsp:Transcript_1804/g.5620  ORF Transcript_1804/g.5620 Transcript_1804/m.5620 type:complete len:257 (+) Transcript_1804:43-813(+)
MSRADEVPSLGEGPKEGDAAIGPRAQWHHELSEYELQRLQFFQLSGRINETLIEILDFWTDIVFVATLFVFSQEGNPVNSFLGFLAATGNLPEVDGQRDFDLFRRLFIVGSIIMLFNVVARFAVALTRLKYVKFFDGATDWVRFLVGIFVCQVEPHNGILFIEGIVKNDLPPKSDYDSTLTEIRMNALLLLAEDIPQFIIQVIFAVNVNQSGLTVSWYVSTLLTMLKITAACGGIGVMMYKLSSLKKKSVSIATFN